MTLVITLSPFFLLKFSLESIKGKYEKKTMKGYKTILSDTYPKKSNRRRDKIKTMKKILNLPVNEFKNLFF